MHELVSHERRLPPSHKSDGCLLVPWRSQHLPHHQPVHVSISNISKFPAARPDDEQVSTAVEHADPVSHLRRLGDSAEVAVVSCAEASASRPPLHCIAKAFRLPVKQGGLLHCCVEMSIEVFDVRVVGGHTLVVSARD